MVIKYYIYCCPVSVCEYYAHLECQDFVVSDCKECAVYVPGSQKVSTTKPVLFDLFQQYSNTVS
jgi:hypothetical protein